MWMAWEVKKSIEGEREVREDTNEQTWWEERGEQGSTQEDDRAHKGRKRPGQERVWQINFLGLRQGKLWKDRRGQRQKKEGIVE